MNGDSQRGRTPYWVALMAILLGLAGAFFLSILAEGIAAAFGASTLHPPPAVNLASSYLFEAAFVGAALYFTLLRGWMGRAEFGYVRISWRLGVTAFLLAAFVYFVGTVVYAQVFSIHATDTLPADLGFHSSVWAAVALAVYACVAAPMAEEFFFRGFLFGVLRRMDVPLGGRQLGPWIAAVVVGVLFGLAHTGSAASAFLIPLGFLGFVLCIVRWKTGSIYPGMALHSVNNCIALGVNEGKWGAGEIVALCVGSLLVIALVTGPISRGVTVQTA